MDTSRIMKMEDLNLVWSREANESIIKGCVILWMQWEAASCLCNFAWVKMGKRIVRRRDRLFCFRRYYPSIFLSWKSFFFWQINVPSFCSLHFSHHFAQWPSFDSKTCLMLHKKKNSQYKWPSFCKFQVNSLLRVQPRNLRRALETAHGAHQPQGSHHGNRLLQPSGIPDSQL